MSRATALCLASVMLLLAGLACGVGSLPQPEPAPPPPAAPTEARTIEKIVTQLVEKEKQVEVVVGAPTAGPAPMGAPAALEPTAAAPVAGPTPADMFFEGYGVNPFIDTEDDHLSTFGLDVDTGSYTLARSYINEGSLPPQEAIRVEEFVNYFDQDYPQPAPGKAFTVTIDGGPFPFAETENHRILRVGIQGREVSPEQRKPAALTFVIDTSGSMEEGARLDLVKRALASLVPQLGADDTVGIVEYSDDASVVLERTGGDDKGTILDAIYRLQPRSRTNAEAGLQLGYRLAESAFNPEMVNRVILLSDGVANVGDTGPESIYQGLREYAEQGITLMTVGVGMGNYNDVLLEQLADQGNGQYAYVDTADEARKIFEQNLTGALQPIAYDAKVQVDFNPEVVARYRLIGFENRAVKDEEFRAPSAKGGGVGAGHNVTALYEIKPQDGAAGRIATIYLRWTDPETKETIEIEQPIDAADLAATFGEESPRLQWDAVVAEYAEILRASPWAEDSTLAGVAEEAERIAAKLPGDSDATEFVELVRKAASLPRAE
jgi:Ca-activated chloride channel family protein